MDKSNMISFIDSRVENEPMVFAPTDISTLRVAAFQHVSISETWGYSMCFGESPEDYGRILPWGSVVGSLESDLIALNEGKCYHLGHGFECLGIQDTILVFLLRICEALLDQILKSGTMGISTTHQPKSESAVLEGTFREVRR